MGGPDGQSAAVWSSCGRWIPDLTLRFSLADRRRSMKLHLATDELGAPVGQGDVPVRPSPEELCESYADRVYQFANMVARDDLEADDLAQTALERALRALPRYRPERGSVSAWLWRIVINAARDAGRAARRRHLLPQRLTALKPRESFTDDIPMNVSDGVLLAAVRRLTPLQRSAIALRFGADLEYADVGSALGISDVAARMATHRALRALRTSVCRNKETA